MQHPQPGQHIPPGQHTQAGTAVHPAPAPVFPAPSASAAPAAAPAPPTQAAAPAPAAAPARTSRPSSPAPRKRAPAPDGEPSWGEPRRRVPLRGKSRDEIGWVKAHGGAGASSLADALGGVDVGARWPEPARGEPRRVMLVGRTSARGLRSVSRALGALKDGKAPQGIDLLGVVLVADAPGRLPLSLLRRIRVVRSVTHVHRVPWIPAWRVGGQPTYLPRQLSALADLVGPGTDGERTVS
ncbi:MULTISPECIES: hypothetical protein [unclassified Streptomyces]|uniref:hypothetical protein n=1 Tax=unclassified Streptomyces TaxID=2593676 RepID=UPI001C40650C|nr:hypothetical protein [Streptomyces sp. AVP053U2]